MMEWNSYKSLIYEVDSAGSREKIERVFENLAKKLFSRNFDKLNKSLSWRENLIFSWSVLTSSPRFDEKKNQSKKKLDLTENLQIDMTEIWNGRRKLIAWKRF